MISSEYLPLDFSHLDCHVAIARDKHCFHWENIKHQIQTFKLLLYNCVSQSVCNECNVTIHWERRKEHDCESLTDWLTVPAHCTSVQCCTAPLYRLHTQYTCTPGRAGKLHYLKFFKRKENQNKLFKHYSFFLLFLWGSGPKIPKKLKV